MELQHLIVKTPVEGDLAVEPGAFIDLFHRWVAEQSLPELLIDVADLRHVPAGPGVVLVGLEADYALDHMGHRWGLLYRRKDVVPGTNGDRLRQALGAVVRAGRRIEQELGGRIRFSRTSFDVIANDRLLAPNTPETLAAVTAELQAFARQALGQQAVALVPHDTDPRRRFGVTVTSPAPFDLT